MGFHNPYMQTPDFGSGFADFKNKALMVLLAMMGMPAPGLGGGEKQQGIQAIGSGGAGSGGIGASPMPPMPPQVNTQTQLPTQGSQMPELPPEIMMMLMQMMQGRKQ